MGANKNSSRRMNSAYATKLTTKGTHTSFPKSHSHNGPTNPRNKPQLKATRKRNTRSKGLWRSAQPGADRPRGGSGLSARAWRTIHKHVADSLKMPPDLPVLHLEKRTIRALPADHLREIRTAWTVRDEQADCPQTPCNQNQPPQQIEP
jgi:hypothetical protein